MKEEIETLEEVAEKTETTETKTSSKMNSRKFVAWIVQAIMSFAVIIFCFITLFAIKNISETTVQTLVGVIEAAMGYFTLVTSVYLGVNFGQKACFSFADAIKSKNQDGEK